MVKMVVVVVTVMVVRMVVVMVVMMKRMVVVMVVSRYTLSLIWHPTLTTGVLPFLGLLYMNCHIFLSIRCTSKMFPLLP